MKTVGDWLVSLIGGYLKRLLVLVDIGINTVLLFGRVETVSSRCGWQLAGGKPCRACAWLCQRMDTWFNGRWKGHCLNNRMDPPKETQAG